MWSGSTMWPDHPTAEVPGMQCESLQGGIVKP